MLAYIIPLFAHNVYFENFKRNEPPLKLLNTYN